MNNSLNRAMLFAVQAHENQYRKNGILPYVVHPIDVMKKLNYLKANDDETLVVALLHDVLEDCKHITPQMIEDLFGVQIRKHIEELTFTGTDKLEYLKSFKDKSILSLVVKYADRVCNIYDFLADDPSYAKKYCHKAKGLFDIVFDRMAEIELEYGIETPSKIKTDYNRLINSLVYEG